MPSNAPVPSLHVFSCNCLGAKSYCGSGSTRPPYAQLRTWPPRINPCDTPVFILHKPLDDGYPPCLTLPRTRQPMTTKICTYVQPVAWHVCSFVLRAFPLTGRALSAIPSCRLSGPGAWQSLLHLKHLRTNEADGLQQDVTRALLDWPSFPRGS